MGKITRTEFTTLTLISAALFLAACKEKQPEAPPPTPTQETASQTAAPPAERTEAPVPVPTWDPPQLPYEAPASFTAEPQAQQQPAAAAAAVQSPAQPPQNFQKDRSGRPVPPRPQQLRGPGNPGPQ